MTSDYKYFNREALEDIWEGLMAWNLWYRMAVLDMRQRYRRTVIGPFWTTLSMAIFICSLGLVFSGIWGQSVTSYLPYLASGFIAWMPLNSMITESATSLVSAKGILAQVRMPISMFAANIVARNMMVMGHHLIVFVLVAVFFDVDLNGLQILAIPAIVLYCINGVWLALLLGMLCARFRDFTPLLSSLLQIAFFITPVFWNPEQLSSRPIAMLLVDFNILHHFVDIFRAPLLGRIPEMTSYYVVGVVTVLGWALTIMVFSRIRHRVIYWL